MDYKLYEVGGKVRDEILGLDSKDIDYSVVIDRPQDYAKPSDAFNVLVKHLESEGYEIFLETPECFTVRVKFPKNHVHSGVADFVLARKELSYKPNSRTPVVSLGQLADDLKRRDFTMNAIAKDEAGYLIDPFNGRKDISDKIIRTPQDAVVSFNDDPLRILRAFRFAVTKGFGLSDDIINAIELYNSNNMSVVSSERIREELKKMFDFDTLKTLEVLKSLSQNNYELYKTFFKGGLRLEPTFKQ